MKSDLTKAEIVDTFMSLYAQVSYDKITVSSIVEACGKNRKTFYYHFVDKQHMILWIWRRELGRLLAETYEYDKLLFECANGVQGDSFDLGCEEFPYYVHNEVGFCYLDHSDFFRCAAEAFDQDRGLYQEFLQTDKHEILKRYLYELYIPAFRKDAFFMLGNRYLNENSMRFIADFYATAFINSMIDGIGNYTLDSLAGYFSLQGNLVHHAIRNEIEEQRLSRHL